MAMAVEFDPDDRNCWYFGPMSRDEANEVLGAERDSGVFLVRDSSSIRGDYVLCVREDGKLSHYIINKLQSPNGTRFKIGDQDFPDLPALLKFYKTHYLDTTSLIRPAPREKVLALFDFGGRDPEDLPFKKGDILTVLQKDEDQWWTAMNGQGQTGQIPVNYTQKYNAEVQRQMDEQHRLHEPQNPGYTVPNITHIQNVANITLQNGQRKLPASARVIQARIPNAYDKTALRLEVGDVVEVTKMNINGQWEGSCNNKFGHFPFTHVKFIDGDEQDADDE